MKKKKKEKKIRSSKYKKNKCCELVGFDKLPDYLQDNEFIRNYYRSEWPMKETILSIFSIHNETLNVWTHLIGFLIFLGITLCTALMIPGYDLMESGLQSSWMLEDVSENFYTPKVGELINKTKTSFASDDLYTKCPPTNFDNTTLPRILFCTQQITNNKEDDTTTTTNVRPPGPAVAARWPFFSFLFGCMSCLLTSSLCHLIGCHSRHMNSIMLRLDYAGVTILIVTSFYPVVYYSFHCHSFFRHLYLTLITLLGLAAIAVSLIPVFQTAAYRPVRAGLFFSMGVSGIVPILHKLALFGHLREEAVVTAAYEVVMGAFYFAGVVVYATRVPERWWPGRFDVVGHSHQLFHLLVVAGAYSHYLAGITYVKWRDVHTC